MNKKSYIPFEYLKHNQLDKNLVLDLPQIIALLNIELIRNKKMLLCEMCYTKQKCYAQTPHRFEQTLTPGNL